MPVLDGVVMELQDCSLPLLHGKFILLLKKVFINIKSVLCQFSLKRLFLNTKLILLSLTEVVGTHDPKVAFNNIDAAILVGAMPRREGMERKDLLKANAKIFEDQGKALDQYAKKTVKVNCFLRFI